jgi:hypothetical protein
MKPLKLSKEQWAKLKQHLHETQPPSVMLSREKMRRVLGFTPREHEEWLGYYNSASKEDRRLGNHGYKKSIHLDFFDEAKRTFFLLKYSDWVGQENENR